MRRGIRGRDQINIVIQTEGYTSEVKIGKNIVPV